MAGKRSASDGDSGLSGRLYAMMAREMADTRNRGKIFWIFATSRPDLLEVDLKRVGRLDVHIPLFSPQTLEDKKELFISLTRKNKVDLKPEDAPDFPADLDIGGNEMEGIIIRASRLYEVQDENQPKKPMVDFVIDAVKNYRPMAHSARLELMALVTILECTDERFLPEKFMKLNLEKVKERIDDIKNRIG